MQVKVNTIDGTLQGTIACVVAFEKEEGVVKTRLYPSVVAGEESDGNDGDVADADAEGVVTCILNSSAILSVGGVLPIATVSTLTVYSPLVSNKLPSTW